GRRAPPRVPGVAGRAPGRAGRARPGLRASGRSPPTRQHSPALMAMLTLCLDIGGTKIAAGLADSSGALVHTDIRPTPPGGGAEEVWAAVAATIADSVRAANGLNGPVAAVGIASAGPIDLRSGTVSPINIKGWHGFPLRDRVAAAVPGVPVRL